MATKTNPTSGFDRDFQTQSGVSPIRYRHQIDLYGTKIGLGVFNPIMVENINKLPDLMDYEDPEFLKSKGLYRVPEKSVNSLPNKHTIEVIKKLKKEGKYKSPSKDGKDKKGGKEEGKEKSQKKVTLVVTNS